MDKEYVITRRNVNTILRDILQYKKIKEEECGNFHLYFRGENKFFPRRTPSLYLNENLTKNGSEYYYRTLINELGRDDYRENTSLVRLISELQHYGAKTRMLDITKSPLIALYFAVEKDRFAVKKDKLKDKHGYLYIYGINSNEEKFDTGHTTAIKCALNLMDQKVINDFLDACKSITNSNKYNDTLENMTQDKIFKVLSIDSHIKISINTFMELLNQRARVREKLIYPLKIYKDLNKAHIILPSKTTDRIRQQQGAFIFPKYVSTYEENQDQEEKSLNDIQKEINDSIEALSTKIRARTFVYKQKRNENKGIVQFEFSCIKINHGDKKVIRDELEQLGITAGFIYPDIEHQSMSLLNED